MDTFKPLVRWTIGGYPHFCGLLCLKKSINSFLKLYKDEFDYIICYNNLFYNQINYIKLLSENFKIPLYEQSACKNMPYEPIGNAWKLYPPRLRPHSHEIFIDNDLIINGKSNIINQFLKSKKCSFITEGFGNYGKYKKYINSKENVNSGFFGIPPNFPFEELIKYYTKNDEIKCWQNYFDEQGIVASCILNHTVCKIIKIDEISICENSLIKTNIGNHFVKLNEGKTECWNEYIKENLFMC
jgi:hypothetical protein